MLKKQISSYLYIIQNWKTKKKKKKHKTKKKQKQVFPNNMYFDIRRNLYCGLIHWSMLSPRWDGGGGLAPGSWINFFFLCQIPPLSQYYELKIPWIGI